jgi:PTS system mannose-specific IIA component
MKGLIIATHADLGAELLRACELIIGPVRHAQAISVQRDNGVEQVQELFQQAIMEVGADGDGVLIMTDMMGGTPANIGAIYMEEGKVDILTGVNLPMVLKFFNSQDDLSLSELANILKAYGQKGVTLVSDLLKK